MKRPIIYLILFFAVIKINAQTLIATSTTTDATANHNQRKIVRDSLDNVYIVFVDSTNQGKLINGIWLNNQTDEWSQVYNIVEGTNPTLSINKFGTFNLFFESNDSLKVILQTSSIDFQNWTSIQQISDPSFNCKRPISDSDSTGNTNVFWIEELSNTEQSLIYARLADNEIKTEKTITTKSEITDIAIANHLQNFNDDIIISLQFENDSLQFFRSKNGFESLDTLYQTIGSQPCITYNAMIPDYISTDNDNPIRLLYLDNSKQLIEIECGHDYYSNNDLPKRTIESNPIDYICIDDILPPMGYSYLYLKNDTLFHAFSYGAEWQWSTILDTVATNPINPSLAYKNFNSLYVDFTWLQTNGSGYDIYYKRDEKHEYIKNGIDPEIEKGFSITGYPNPFNDRLQIDIALENKFEIPLIEIYDSNARKIETLNPTNQMSFKYSYQWEANNQTPTGLYFIKCSVGQKTTIRKVILRK